MRLLIVTQYFWPENFRINDLAAEMVRRGHEVTVLTGVPNYPDGKVFESYRNDPRSFDEYEGAEVIRVPLIPRGNNKFRLLANYISFAMIASLLAPLKLSGRKFDAVFTYQLSPVSVAIPAIVVKATKRIPMAMWILDLWPESLTATVGIKNRFILKSVGALVGLVYRNCDLILSQSHSFISKIRERAAKPRIEYFPSWAERVFDTAECSAAVEVETKPDTFNVMFAGNIGESQDFPSILKAAESLKANKAIRWLIVGDGRMSKWVSDEIMRCGLEDSFILLGRYSLERMPEFFEHADALLVSLKDEPIFALTVPGKLQSYLATGKPVLAMINGEGASIIERSGAGLACDSGDYLALGAAVEKMSKMTVDERKVMGQNGLDYSMKEFDRSMLLNRFEGLIQNMVKETNR